MLKSSNIIIKLSVLFILAYSQLMASDWELSSMPENDNGNSWEIIECYDSKNCIMVGFDWNNIPRVMVTTNAGDTWEYVLNKTWQDYVADHSLKHTRPVSAYYNNNKIILSCLEWNDHEPYILRSFDGGNEWKTIKINTPYAGYIYFEDDYGIMVAGHWIYQSNDNGANWELLKDIAITTPGKIKDFNFVSINEFSFLLDNYNDESAKIYKTKDMGDSWDIIDIPYITGNMYYSFFNDDIGYLAGSKRNGNGDRRNAIVFKTIDGGNKWNEVLNEDLSNELVFGTFGINDIVCIDEQNVIIVGSSRLAAITIDGGEEWEIISDGLSEVDDIDLFKVVEFVEPNIILAGGWSNLIARTTLEHLTLSVEENVDFNNFTIFPNPVKDELKIEIMQLSEGFQQSDGSEIAIYNILGEKVVSKPIQPTASTHKMSVEALSPGLYFLVIGNNVKRFIKE